MLLSDAVGAVRAVRLLLLSDVGLLLSGAVGWSAVGVLSEPEHTSHTYDTIKRRPAGLYYTYSQPLLLHGVITPAAAAAWGAHMAAQAQAAAAAQTAAATPTQTP